jgi:hypothetical protein
MLTTTNTPSPTGYAGRTVTKPPDWHGLVAFDVLFNNLATGLFLVAAVGELAAPAVFAPVATWAYPIALVLLLADLALLVLDLGDPLRFHHMLRVFKPSSPMSLGTWCLTAFSLLLTAIVAVEVVVAAGGLPGDTGLAWWVRKLAIVGGLPFAFGSAAYKGVLFSTTAQPGWRDARWLGAYLVNAALMLGTGELLVIAALSGESRAVDVLLPAVVLLIVLNVVPLALLAKDFLPVVARHFSPRGRGAAAILVLLIGVVVPVGLLLVGGGPVFVAGALVALILASLGVRFAIVRLPHSTAER